MNHSHKQYKIPKELVADRAARTLITRWRDLHLRYRVCSKRVYWYKKNAGAIEKRRRKEKWVVIAQILVIEQTILRWLAKTTHHPDLWTSPDPDTPESHRRQLLRQYREARTARRRYRYRDLSKSEEKERDALQRAIAVVVADIRALEREWMLAFYRKVHPDGVIPNPIKMHATELRPRKVKQASKLLDKELR